MNKLAKVLVAPDGDGWKIEIIDESGQSFFVHKEAIHKEVNEYGYRMGALYQLNVEILN